MLTTSSYVSLYVSEVGCLAAAGFIEGTPKAKPKVKPRVLDIRANQQLFRLTAVHRHADVSRLLNELVEE